MTLILDGRHAEVLLFKASPADAAPRLAQIAQLTLSR